MEANMNSLVQLLSILGAGQPAGTGIVAQTPAQTVKLPFGCYDVDYKGRYLAKSVNELNTWEETVLCEDGGTHQGVKIRFIDIKSVKKSDKAYSQRKSQIARFEISRAGGRNPMNEVVNVFIKGEGDHTAYLDPTKWEVTRKLIEFKNIEDANDVRVARLNMVTFMDELISDSPERKAIVIAKRLGEDYVCFIDGVQTELATEV